MKKLMPLLLGAVLIGNTVACSKPSDNKANITASNPQTQAIPAGTSINGILQEDLSTAKNANNQRFTLKVKDSSLKDAQIQGHLEEVIKAARGKKASLHLVIDDIVLKDGSTYPIDATLTNTEVESKTQGKFLQNAGVILGGAVAGHFLGDKAKFKHGGLAGSAAAAAFVLSSPGGEVVLKKGTNVKLKLKTPLDITP
ncbi:MAG: hypothetical protein H0X31_13600 [Nostocaceae cyanobacterium]|nr:hypothetical protein [Nostocaceae cyanobacterium]